MKVDGPEFYLGTFNAGAGLSFNLTKRREVQREVQLGIFYQKDLGGIRFRGPKNEHIWFEIFLLVPGKVENLSVWDRIQTKT